MQHRGAKIVVLDGFTLNPGDLSWAGLEALGPCTVYPRTPPDQVVARALEADIVLTNKTLLAAETLPQLPRLQYIGVLATGYNVVDINAARQRGIPVTNVPAYAVRSVAQMVFAHILEFTQHVAAHSRSVAEGRWAACDDFCYWDAPLIELAEKTMGIVGFGRIGQATAEIALAFGMEVLAYDTHRSTASLPVEFVDLDTLFRESDIVSLHCPLTPATQALVSRERLAMMKRTALLINTARGPLIDEEALAEALAAGGIAGAGLDVLATEPPPTNHPLVAAENCQMTPHIAWASRASRRRLLQIAVDNVAAFLAGSPQNVVDP